MVSYHEDNDIGVIEFNDTESEINLLSKINIEALGKIVDVLVDKGERIRAVFFTSKKENVFIAGADIKELALICTQGEVFSFCRKGQGLFNKIDDLSMPTFAIIDGVCVGGGLELALSCDYIFATTNKGIKIGLPEVRLGIFPGFGGPHRLKEKIGIERADSLLKSGELVDIKEARRLGIVDRIIPESKKGDFKGLASIRLRARKAAVKFSIPRDELEEGERKIVAERIFQQSARYSLSSYVLINKYRDYEWLDSGVKKPPPVISCSIIGAGTMGRGIAYLISLKGGCPVRVTDTTKHVLRKAKSYIRNDFKDAVDRGILQSGEAISRFEEISFGKSFFKGADIVIESITEDALKKKALFSEIEESLRKDCIIATNTSCISVEELSRSLRSAERFIGMHFFNPAYKMKLVELIPTRFTSERVLAKAISFLRSLKRIPIVVKDSPGFVVNRMILPYLNEAMFMIDEGLSPEDIEAAMLDFGMSMGPLRLLREIGDDVVYRASKILEEGLGKRVKAAKSLGQNLGQNLGQSLGQKGMVDRLLHPIRREAELCLREGLVDSREVIDLALMLGVGFPRSKRIWNI